MVEWLPIEPILDATVRHSADRLPYYYGLGVIYAWNLWKWERQKRTGKRRDAKDREQDSRLDRLEGKPHDMFPLEKREIGGYRFGDLTWYTLHHLGVDYKAAKGTPLRAPFDGEILSTFKGLEGGNMIYYRPNHDKGCVMRFMHLDSFAVGNTGPINKGDLIGHTGNTGILTTGPHLHLDINRNPSALLAGRVDFKDFVDPEKYDWAGPAVSVPVEVPSQPVGSAPFSVNLEPSQSKRPEVERVQRFLKAKGFFPDIADNEYGYYGKKTQAAVDRFQKANGIPNATKYGYWYDATRAKANQQLN